VLIPFCPWQLLQFVASAAPRAALPSASRRRVAAVQATVDAGCAASGAGTGAFPLGKPTARQMALQRSSPSAPR
jgi:hypothetical protein